MHTASPPSATGNAGAPGGGHAAPPRWQLRLFGAFGLSDGSQRLTRLASRPMVALLARLALAPDRNHPHEELVELLWPGVDPQVSRNRLRQTLSVLRSVLEPPGAVPAPVLLADRHDVRLLRGAIDCDVLAFEREARLGHAAQALALYRGELLPGYFDERVLDERQRLEALSERLAAHEAAAAARAARTTSSCSAPTRSSTSDSRWRAATTPSCAAAAKRCWRSCSLPPRAATRPAATPSWVSSRRPTSPANAPGRCT